MPRMRTPSLTAGVLAALLVACLPERDPAGACCDVEIVVTVPAGTGTVYVAGNWPDIGAYLPDAFPMTGEGRERRVVINLPEGYPLEYRFTLGGWDAQGAHAREAGAGHYVVRSAVGAWARHDIVAFVPGPPPLAR